MGDIVLCSSFHGKNLKHGLALGPQFRESRNTVFPEKMYLMTSCSSILIMHIFGKIKVQKTRLQMQAIKRLELPCMNLKYIIPPTTTAEKLSDGATPHQKLLVEQKNI